jgi:hypothetical protein
MAVACQICGSPEAARSRAPGVFLTETGLVFTAKNGQQMPSMVWLPFRRRVNLTLKIMKTKPTAEAGQALVESNQKDQSRRNQYVRQIV